MKIYRVQDSSGSGPYRESMMAGLFDMIKKHNNPTHPCPVHDIGIERFIQPDEFCGFQALFQLRMWFEGFEKILDEHLFRILTFEAAPTAIGEYQVLFKKEEATFLASRGII